MDLIEAAYKAVHVTAPIVFGSVIQRELGVVPSKGLWRPLWLMFATLSAVSWIYVHWNTP